jgi:hypothetical protein
MKATARHREMERDVERVAKNPIDRATSHWWRGLIILDHAQGGSQLRPEPTETTNHPWGRYGDRLELSHKENIFLAIPNLCAHLQLSKFERDVLILCLAPEISRRYERLYSLLNNDDVRSRQPTVDLALRLFCRSDQEWRTARASFLPNGKLIKNKLLLLQPSGGSAQTLLSHILVLPAKVVHFCLSDRGVVTSILPRNRRKRPTAP